MTYETTHLLIGVCVGGGEYFQGEGQEKYCCVTGGGGGHYMKNKNIAGMCFVNST